MRRISKGLLWNIITPVSSALITGAAFIAVHAIKHRQARQQTNLVVSSPAPGTKRKEPEVKASEKENNETVVRGDKGSLEKKNIQKQTKKDGN